MAGRHRDPLRNLTTTIILACVLGLIVFSICYSQGWFHFLEVEKK